MPETSDVDKADEQQRGREYNEKRRMEAIARFVFLLAMLFVLGVCLYVLLANS